MSMPEYKKRYKQSIKGKQTEQRYRNKNADKIKERQKLWIKEHPVRWKEMQKKQNIKKRMQNPNYCAVCGNIIPYGSKEHTPYVYCSDNCRKIAKSKANKIFKKVYSNFFIKEKEKQGCSICGYDKCGACLDYHHINNKRFRISASRFYRMNSETVEELHECMLLCKNCHYELHFKENGDVEE
jgi:predicted nucleic acid-binding Zn ribbon protein